MVGLDRHRRVFGDLLGCHPVMSSLTLSTFLYKDGKTNKQRDKEIFTGK
jgi:hypothetical protein